MIRPLLAAACGLLLCAQSSLQADIVNFGSGANQFNMEFVEIGAPGNTADTTGNPNPAGAVSYVYNIGKFEVSRDMVTKANAEGGLGITLNDMTSFGGNGADRPATGVSWNEAARFVNWLNTSQGFSPAYKFATQPGDGGYSANVNIELWVSGDTGFDASNPFRNSEAQYFLPSVDEWYKAAYYDPVSETYGDYPTSDGTVPTAVTNGTTDKTAVYNQSTSQGPADIADAGGLSAFGIMGMGGNVWEWEETEFDLVNNSPSSLRGLRGGSWNANSGGLAASGRSISSPTNGSSVIGFRVASPFSETVMIPEPSGIALGLISLAGLALWLRRFRKTSL